VQELFARYLEPASSLIGLAKQVQAQGVPTPQGKTRWNLATLRGILTNPTYTGQVYAGRMTTRPPRSRRSATHPIGQPTATRVATPRESWIPVASIPAVISQAQFDQVQAKLAQNQQFARRNNTAHAYLLRALVSCGMCQTACMGRSDRGRYAYYVCRAKGQPLVSCRDSKCAAGFIPAAQLDELVWQDLCAVLTHPESIIQALERAHGGHWLPQELQARRENVRKAQVGLAHQIERLTDAYLAGIMSLLEYQQRRGELERKQQALEQQLQQLAAQVDRQQEVAVQASGIVAFCERVQSGLANATFEQRRQLVELLIDRVVVTNDEVEIRYVIPTSPRGEHERFCHLRLDYFDLPARLIQPHHCRGGPRLGREGGDQQPPAREEERGGGDPPAPFAGLALLARLRRGTLLGWHRAGNQPHGQPVAPIATAPLPFR
jgi:site-specific DNA recombinase